MAGILNTKTRIFDTIITNEGRRQLATGGLQIRFVSFTDGSTFYQPDAISGSADASRRLFLEATSRRQDQIVFKSDDEGELIPFYGSDLIFSNGLIISSSIIVPPGDRFVSLADRLIRTSIDNFRNLYLIGTEDVFLDESEFNLSLVTASFYITDNRPLKVGEDVISISIDDAESFFQDRHLSHIDNFKYLPPVLTGTTQSLGRFADVSENNILSYSDLVGDLSFKESKTVTFYNTSRESNLVSQVFELTSGRLIKLDIIDFGEFVTDDDRPIKHVYFVGKVYEDSNGMNTFVNLFTIVFD